jgi:hypothetical protein
MPRTSSSFMMRYSSPSSSTSLPGVLAEEHAIPASTWSGVFLPVSDTLPFDFPFLRLLLGAVRDDDAAAPSLFLLDSLDEDAIVQGL